MKHLTAEQMADAAHGGTGAAATGHLSSCALCAAKLRELQAVLQEVGAVKVPEPSPIFWQQFAAKVNTAIDEEQQARVDWHWPWVAAWAGAAILIIGFIATFASRPGEIRQQTAATQSAPGEAVAASSETLAAAAPIGMDEDEAWAVVRSLASDLHYDDAREAGVVPQPGAVEREVAELSEDERARLIRLIEEETQREHRDR